LIIQRAVEEEFDTWLGRARYERRPERQRGLRNHSGMRNGLRPRHVQTAEAELRIALASVPLSSTARGVGVRGVEAAPEGGRIGPALVVSNGCRSGVRAVQHMEAGRLTAAVLATVLARAL
jgi:hypothetical protein